MQLKDKNVYVYFDIQGLEDAAALDYFVKDNRVCWTEISLSKIRCSILDPDKQGVVAKVRSRYVI